MKTAYRPETFNRLKDQSYVLLDLAFKAGREWGKTSAQVDQEVNSIIGSVPEYPRQLRHQLRGYADALRRHTEREHVRFLYKVKGKFYSVSNSADTGLPSWDTLPREMWDKLGPLGGLYWKGSLKPYYLHEGAKR